MTSRSSRVIPQPLASRADDAIPGVRPSAGQGLASLLRVGQALPAPSHLREAGRARLRRSHSRAGEGERPGGREGGKGGGKGGRRRRRGASELGGQARRAAYNSAVVGGGGGPAAAAAGAEGGGCTVDAPSRLPPHAPAPSLAHCASLAGSAVLLHRRFPPRTLIPFFTEPRALVSPSKNLVSASSSHLLLQRPSELFAPRPSAPHRCPRPASPRSLPPPPSSLPSQFPCPEGIPGTGGAAAAGGRK